MAIEFHCPYCSAAIRVADGAGGKQGKCPACAKRLIVPSVSTEAAGPAANAPPAAPFAFGADASPGATTPGLPFPGAPGAFAGIAENELPGAAFPAALPGELPVADGPVRRRAVRPRGRGLGGLSWLLMPVLMASVFIGGGMIYVWSQKPKLEGDLKAVAIPGGFSLPPQRIAPQEGDVDPDLVDAAVAGLQERPEVLFSERMRVRFSGDAKRGAHVSVEPGGSTRFVRLDLGANAFLSQYCSQHADEFDAPRQHELRVAAKKFFSEYGAARRENRAPADIPSYRDPLGLAAMTGGVGYVVEAVAGTAAYRCVGEDSSGKLYFLLPASVKSFQLRGRKLDDGRALFEGRYTVHVEPTAEEQRAKAAGKGTEQDDAPSPKMDKADKPDSEAMKEPE